MIAGEIKRFLRDDGMLKVSRSIKENQYRIYKMREKLEKNLGREPTVTELAEELGMDALVEAHDENEVARALKTGAKIVGVNNRDLKTFKVDMNNSIRLRNLAPDNVVFVSESGIKNAGDIAILERNRVGAVLIGETLMRSPDKKAALENLNGGALV